MVKSDSEAQLDGYLFLGVLAMIFLNWLAIKLNPQILYFQKLESKISSFFSLMYAWSHSHQFYSLILAGLALFVFYAIYKVISNIIKKFKEIKYRRKSVKWGKEYIEKLLGKNVENLKDEEVKRLILDLEAELLTVRRLKELSKYKEALSLKLYKAQCIVEKKKYEKEVWNIEREKMALNEEIEELDKKRIGKMMTEEQIKTQIAFDFLRDGENAVHIRTLSKREIDALIEHKFYSRANEYCILHKKIEAFLVKKYSNHSNTHTFLVWNVKKILKSMKEIRSIHEHGAIDADLTFIYHNRKYALEIETGTLLSKKKQLDEKVKSLNQKYSKRWMFVVSNKNLVSKYRKFGPSTQRTQVAEKLEKLLNSYTRPFRVD